MRFAATLIKLEGIMVSEISKRERTNIYAIQKNETRELTATNNDKLLAQEYKTNYQVVGKGRKTRLQ